MTQSSAFGKAILFGEHAVVYGRAAIAVPVADVRATVDVHDQEQGFGTVIDAQDIGRLIRISDAGDEPPVDEPLSLTVRNTLAHLGVNLHRINLSVTIHSTIPVASGLGSGAAVTTALVRAVSAHLGQPLDADAVSALVYETEKIFHGAPSGIDNMVIALEQPVYFRKGRSIETFAIKRPFWLAIADTGRPGLTKESVADVRAAWQKNPDKYNAIFDEIGAISDAARQAIETGENDRLGPLMVENQRWLGQLDVSSPELERLIEAAGRAGAAGAKLSGGGRGGNMIALIAPETQDAVRRALLKAGAKNVIVTGVGT